MPAKNTRRKGGNITLSRDEQQPRTCLNMKFRLMCMAKMPPPIIKLAMPVSLTPTLSQWEREQTNRCASFTLNGGVSTLRTKPEVTAPCDMCRVSAPPPNFTRATLLPGLSKIGIYQRKLRSDFLPNFWPAYQPYTAQRICLHNLNLGKY